MHAMRTLVDRGCVARAESTPSTFRAAGFNHIALEVTNLGRFVPQTRGAVLYFLFEPQGLSKDG